MRCVTFAARAVALCGAVLAPLQMAHALDSVSPADAASKIGKTVTVCGLVASANYAEKAKGSPTFLNLDKAYPDNVFTILIRSEDRPKFGTPERTMKGKRVCASGKVTDWQGKPEMILKDPSQLTVQ